MSDRVVENTVVVKIFGEEYPITSAGDPEHIRRVADFVDARMREVAQISRSKAKEKVAILTALSIASELVEKRDQLRHIESDRDDCVDSMLSRLEATLADTPAEKR
jgi:cell division protein ZapA